MESMMWVFAYGSLMWNPGFDFVEQAHARLYGYHRSLCINSWVYRGTQQAPGLVLGLDRGGSCQGVAFRVSTGDVGAVTDYLRARELVTNVYMERHGSIHLLDGTARKVSAKLFVVDRHHLQYAGRRTPSQLLSVAKSAVGKAGTTADYVISTAEHLEQRGSPDPTLSWLAAKLTSR
jgi:cation transport protein ChaC